MLHFLPVLIPSCPLFLYLDVELFQSSVEVLTLESCSFFVGNFYMKSTSFTNTSTQICFLFWFFGVPNLVCIGEVPVIDTHVVVETQEGSKGLGHRRAPWQPAGLALHVLSHGCTLFPGHAHGSGAC